MNENQFKPERAKDASQEAAEQIEEGKNALGDLKKRLESEGADNSILTFVENDFWARWNKAVEKYDPKHTSGATFKTYLHEFTAYVYSSAKREMAKKPRHISIHEHGPESDSDDSNEIEDCILGGISSQCFENEQARMDFQDSIRSFFEKLQSCQMSDYESQAFRELQENLNLWFQDPESDDLFDSWDKALILRLVLRQPEYGKGLPTTPQRTRSVQVALPVHPLSAAIRRADLWQYWSSPAVASGLT